MLRATTPQANALLPLLTAMAAARGAERRLTDEQIGVFVRRYLG